MEAMMNATNWTVSWLAIACSCLSLATGVRADGYEHRDGDGDRDQRDSPAALSAQWWQWAFSVPAATNPLLDGTGAYCMVGQRGRVWFLAGAVTGQPVERTCTIPEGVELFFPVVNWVFVNTPGCGGQDATEYSTHEERAILSPLMDTATELSVSLDKHPVRILPRIRSVPFAAVFPPDGFGGDCVAGRVYWPSVDDGYYARIDGLRAGQHRLSIKGKVTAGNFAVDVVYKLNVVKRHSH